MDPLLTGLTTRYADKLVAQGLASEALAAGLDAELVWSAEHERTTELSGLFDRMNINSLVAARPAEPYAGIIEFLARRAMERAVKQGGPEARIRPEDCETRTFLHDLPVTDRLEAEPLARALARRKGAVVLDRNTDAGRGGVWLVAHGTVSPEQGFVTISSICFACFVLFFTEYLRLVRSGQTDAAWQEAFERACGLLPGPVTVPPVLHAGPWESGEAARTAMRQAGRAVVGLGLVDSYFGNISARVGDVVHISQTGSSLDELEGCIDPVPLDGSSTAGLTASSELTAHADIYRTTGFRTILHGHPRFTVILSMDCPGLAPAGNICEVGRAGECHLRCPEQRLVCGVPVVPGEVGTGRYGLCHTLPPALVMEGAGVVWGHGLFTAGERDFNEPLARMLAVENQARRIVLERAGHRKA